MSIYQRDRKVAEALLSAGLPELLDENEGLVHKGKGERMVIGIALAAIAQGPANGQIQITDHGYTQVEPKNHLLCDRGCAHCTGAGIAERCCTHGCCGSQTSADAHIDVDCVSRYYKYIGFIDADNSFPGSVEEYCRAFSAGLHRIQTEDAMVRIRWASKPKVSNGKLEFKKSGRSSEMVNWWLNTLLKEMDAKIDGSKGKEGDQTDLICTGNAGEHAMTISLALKLRFASGYAIEPFHFMDLFERFSGGENAHITCASPRKGEDSLSSAPQPMPAVQIVQIGTINPHFHESRGEDHITRIWQQGLSCIYHSPVTSKLSQYRDSLRSTILGSGTGEVLANISTSPSLGTTPRSDESEIDMEPEIYRIYQFIRNLGLNKFRNILESEGGSFWWSEKEEVGTD